MHRTLRMMAAAMLALTAPVSFAQSTTANCPALTPSTDLRWEALNGPDFLFCRALRADGSEAFAVTISSDSPFKPRRVDRAEQGSIGGQPGYWYRSEIAGDSNPIAREALVELNGGKIAHVSLRASSDAQKADAMRQVEALDFADVRLSSN